MPTKKKIKKAEWDNINNKWELIGFLISKYWWAVVLVLMSVGFLIGGCNIKTTFIEYQKDPIHLKGEATE
jgi:hypothetical protein